MSLPLFSLARSILSPTSALNESPIEKDHLGEWSPEKYCCKWLRLRQPVRKPSSGLLRWLPHRLSKRQSLTTVLLRTLITRMTFCNQGMLLLGSNHLVPCSRTTTNKQSFSLYYPEFDPIRNPILVFLTALTGRSFGNRVAWITEFYLMCVNIAEFWLK